MILGLHIRESKNAGDVASCPLNYFEFQDEVVIADMRKPVGIVPDMVIYGGGSITAAPTFHKWECPVVAWGVGHHIRKEPWRDEMLAEHKRAAELCDLYFPRDQVDGFDIVPCASCMNSVFDEQINPVHKVVRYSAARRVDISNGIDPHMTNEDTDIKAAVRFLGSGEKVITSSYHGAYWARLLGREVEMVSWGSKFYYLPEMSLEQCRNANRVAYEKVLELNG